MKNTMEGKLHIYCQHFQNTSRYKRYPNGLQYCGYVENHTAFLDVIQAFEDANWFPNDDGSVNDCNGDVVYTPGHPYEADFGDYRYILSEAKPENEEIKPAIYR